MIKIQKQLLIDRCENMCGSLDQDCKARLRAVLNNPNNETWQDAHSLIIGTGYTTLWQAWVAIDNNAPRGTIKGKWTSVPDKFTLYRAIKHATKSV